MRIFSVDSEPDGSVYSCTHVLTCVLVGFSGFYSEMRETLQRAKEERITTENLKVEINSLK